MHFQTLFPILAIFGTAVVAAPSGRSPITGNAIAARGGNSDSYCDPTRRVTSDQQKDIFKKFKNKMYGDEEVIDAFNKHVAKDLVEHGPYDLKVAMASPRSSLRSSRTANTTSWAGTTTMITEL